MGEKRKLERLVGDKAVELAKQSGNNITNFLITQQHDSRMSELTVFALLQIIESEELWTKPTYYRDSKKEDKQYMEKTFKELLEGYHGYYHLTKYQNMSVCATDLGKDFFSLYLKYGWDDGLATYNQSTKDEKTKIISLIEAGERGTIRKIRDKIRPPKRTKKYTDSEITKLYNEITRRDFEIRKLTIKAKRVDRLEAENKELRDILESISDTSDLVKAVRA